MSRYARQMVLPEIGAKGQAAIADARVLVVGAGGLAAPALQYLVGAGVGHLTLVDGDVVSLSNLHRQTLFREADVGKLKVAAVKTTLQNLNSDCKITTHAEPLDPGNARTLIEDNTLVLDCADSFAASYTVSDICCELGVPLITASVLGFSGYVGGFCATAPSLRAVFPDLPDRAATCATAGVLGPVVGLLGAAQAQMALGVILGQTPSPLGQMMSFDMHNFRTSGFRFDTAPEPARDLEFISSAMITDDDLVIELRDTTEAPIAVTQNAVRTTVADYKTNTQTPAARQRAVFTCRSGLRAWQAASHLRTQWGGEISLIAMGDTPQEERSLS